MSRKFPPDPPLDYPCGDIPAYGSAQEVAPGVLWVPMPLPMALNRINLWLIEDGDGWSLVDTGLRTADTEQHWEQVLAGPMQGRPLKRVIATHMHPDHTGMAGWLTRRFGCELWMTRLEYLTCRLMAADTGRPAPQEGLDFYRHAGWDEASLERYRTRFGTFGKGLHAMPESYRRINDGDTLRIGAHLWRVVVGNGHSPEHACLHCPELDVLISGDQLLPRISSNVSVHPTEPEADPFTDWLDSLDKLQREIPPHTLILPAHNEPFRGLLQRLHSLRQEHAAAFERLLEVLPQPHRLIDLISVLFNRRVRDDAALLGFATGEALACVNHLRAQGRVQRHTDATGIDWYSLHPGGTPQAG